MSILMVQERGGLSGLFQSDPNLRADQLEKWWEEGTVLSLGGKENFDSIIIESLSATREAESADARTYDVVLKQVRIADTDAVQLGGTTRDQETEEVT